MKQRPVGKAKNPDLIHCDENVIVSNGYNCVQKYLCVPKVDKESPYVLRSELSAYIKKETFFNCIINYIPSDLL